MGFVLSGVPPRDRYDVVHGMYQTYKWTSGQIAANIRAGKLTPIFDACSEATPEHPVSCEICYNYFPLINRTNCCQNQICTECIAASISAPNLVQNCVFCRRPEFSVTPNLKQSELKKTEEDEEKFQAHEQKVREGFDFDTATGCSDEALAIALTFNQNVQTVNQMLDAGMSVQELIEKFSPRRIQPVTPPVEPVKEVLEQEVAEIQNPEVVELPIEVKGIPGDRENPIPVDFLGSGSDDDNPHVQADEGRGESV